MNRLILNFQQNTSSLVMFVYLINVILISLLYNNPLLTVSIFLSLFIMSVLTRFEKIWSYLKFSSLIFVITILFNVILNQRGSKVILQVPFVKVTIESLLNGTILGISFVNLLWSFYLYDALVRVKVVFELLSNLFKSIAIIFILTIKFIPQIIQIYTETKVMSRFRNSWEQGQPSFWQRIRQTVDLNEVILNKSIASFMNVSDTLTLRGYDHRHKRFGRVEFSLIDGVVTGLILVSLIFNIFMSILRFGKVNFGSADLKIVTDHLGALIIVNCLMILLPVIIGGVNFIWWKCYVSKTTVSDTTTVKNYR